MEFHQIALAGELTLSRASELRALLRDALANADALDVSLASVERCDTAGIQVLLVAQREAERAEKRLRLLRPSESLARVFALLRLSSIVAQDEETRP